jgi:hypothetical protein
MHRDHRPRPAHRNVRTWLIALGCVLVAGLVGLSTAGAKTTPRAKTKKPTPAAPTTKTVHLCVLRSTSAVRIVGLHAHCAKGERSVLLQGPRGPAGPTGPANTEEVQGPAVTLNGAQPTGSIATSTAGCDHAVNGANREAYGGGVSVVTHPTTATPDILAVESSYPGVGVTGQTPAVPPAAGLGADAYTATVAISRMFTGDTATVQAYVICGP